MNQTDVNVQEKLMNRVRLETERSIKQSEVVQLAERSFLAGILTICFITFGVGIIAMGLAFYFGVRSNRLADELQIPREKKAKIGIMLAYVPLVVGLLAGIVCGILAVCGVI
jgi:uncharacterized membrane protein YidH (DUF202 family)